MDDSWRDSHLRDGSRPDETSYPLPPISTLSAALQAAGPIAIAPELMGEEGLPPRRGEYDEQPYTTGGGFQSSSTRDDRMFQSENNDNAHGWDDDYRFTQEGYDHDHSHLTDPHIQGQGQGQTQAQAHAGDEAQHASSQAPNDGLARDGSDSPKAPAAKKRRTTKRKEKEEEINLDQDMEYAHPSRDPKLGPVFVHPPKEAAQACVRCHRIKRKCDAGRPRCKGCEKADVPCVFELSPATSSYVHQLKAENETMSSQITSAHERIQQLEMILSSVDTGTSHPGQDQNHRETFPSQGQGDHNTSSADAYRGLGVGAGGGHSPRADFQALAKNILSVRSTSFANPVFGAVPIDALHPGRRPSSQQSSTTQPGAHGEQPTQAPYPPYQLALQAVETFFICNAISYPLLDKTEFLRDMDDLYSRASASGSASGGNAEWSADEAEVMAGKEFVLFMVIAIGTTNKERMGEVERGTSKVFRSRAMLGLTAAVSKEDILCVQSLILLGIYAMFDPSGISLWHVVGFAARVAIALGLHRRADDAGLPSGVIEQRKRVFYSLFNLDRLVATTLSKPLAIADNDIDVELPSPLDSDSPYRGIPRIVLTQHIVKLRRLSGVILTTVYSVSGSQNSLPEPERAAIIADLHTRLDQWLAECPVPPSEEEHKPGMIHNNHSWFMLNHQQGLCLLYRPSPLYPVTTPDRLRALHDASTRCVDLYLELWHEHKVSYNLINVSMQFLACISLLYCLCEYDNRSPQAVNDPSWRKEVAHRVGQCTELLDAFSRALPETAKYREIFSRLSEMLLARHGPLQLPKRGGKSQRRGGAKSHPSATSASNPVPPSAAAPVGQITPADVLSDPGILSTGVVPAIDPSIQGSLEGADLTQEPAWAAMAQLWQNGGDFAFDESALGIFAQAMASEGSAQAEGSGSGSGGVQGGSKPAGQVGDLGQATVSLSGIGAAQGNGDGVANGAGTTTGGPGLGGMFGEAQMLWNQIG